MRKAASALAVLMALAVLPATGLAQPRTTTTVAGPSDVREVDPNTRPPLDVSKADAREARALGAHAAAPVVGEQRIWLALDDEAGKYYPKVYTLRGIGEHIEVWVADDSDDVSTGLAFPEGDCRNDDVRDVISDEDVQYLIDQFDTTIYPTESEAFSVPPSQDGSDAPLTSVLGLPRNYYRGQGDRVVTLIDNVRDQNFYDTDNAKTYTYIAGFFSGTFDFFFNRLVMTIDAFDWLHRTGATPPNAPSEDPCLNAVAKPFLYESVFAHEYQHLLESYVDPDEVNWINEGLSDYARTITGYTDDSLPVTQVGFDNHVQCLLGWDSEVTPANPIPGEGGPENSLTRWEDQTDFENEILCDYGAAASFMEYLAEQFGTDFMKALHLDGANGLDSLSRLLHEQDATLTVGTVITRWALMLAVDKVLDVGWTIQGADAADVSTDALNADINWDNDQAYSAPGAPPNGSDYVRLRDDAGAYLDVGDVTSITFDAATEYPPKPLEWSVDRRPPAGADGAALSSGQGNHFDRSLAREVRVPRGADLEFDTLYGAETDFDYAYVQVSTDGGEHYRSARCTTSVDGPLGPAFNGRSGGWVHERCNLARFDGRDAIVAFRYVTDARVKYEGFWVDNVTVGRQELSTGSSLRGWDSITQINPTDVQAVVVQLVAFDEAGHVVHVAELPLDASLHGSLDGQAIADALGTSGSTVAAIVTVLDRTETAKTQTPYTLTVNGVVQPGGGQS